MWSLDVICIIVSVREEQEEGMQALMQRLARISTSDCDLLEAPLAPQQPATETSSAAPESNGLSLALGAPSNGNAGGDGVGGFMGLGLDAGASFAAGAGTSNPFAAGIPWVGTPQSKPIPAQPPPTPNSQSPLTSPTCSLSSASLSQQLDMYPCLNSNVSFPDASSQLQPQPTQDLFFAGGGAFASAVPAAAPLVSPIQSQSPAPPVTARVAIALNPLAEQQSSAHRALSIERSDAFVTLKQQTTLAPEPPPEHGNNPDSTSDMCL